MIILTKVLRLYYKSSIHVALAVVSLFLFSIKILDIKIDNFIAFTIFFGVIFGYNILRYADSFVRGVFVLHQHRFIVAITFLSLLFGIVFFVALEPYDQRLFLVSVFMVVCYPWVRKLAFLKLLYVSLAISWMTTVFAFGDDFSVFYEVLFWQRFLLVFSLLVPFEISDVLEDSLPFKTLPQSVGVSNFKVIGLLSLVLYGMLSLYLPFVGVHIFIGILSVLAILYSHPQRSLFFTYFWVESIPIAGFLGLLGFKYLF